jgi:hypothetical protein
MLIGSRKLEEGLPLSLHVGEHIRADDMKEDLTNRAGSVGHQSTLPIPVSVMYKHETAHGDYRAN